MPGFVWRNGQWVNVDDLPGDPPVSSTRHPSRTLAVTTTDVATTSVDGTEDRLFARTIPAGQLSRDGDRIDFAFRVTTVAHPTATRAVYVRFGDLTQQIMGLQVGVTATALRLSVSGSIIRKSSTSVRGVRSGIITTELGAATGLTSGAADVTGLDLDSQLVLEVTGKAAGVGAAPGDIALQYALLDFVSAPT